MRTRVGVLLTSSRHVSGLYEVGAARLSDALNNTLESVVRLTNATLGRLGNPYANEPAPFAVVPKAQIALVYAEVEATRQVDRRMATYVPKQTTELLVLVAGLRVRGRAHASGPLDPNDLQRLIAQSGDRFVVLTDAHLALDVEGTTDRNIGVAMLNARHIQFVVQTKNTLQWDPYSLPDESVIRRGRLSGKPLRGGTTRPLLSNYCKMPELGVAALC